MDNPSLSNSLLNVKKWRIEGVSGFNRTFNMRLGSDQGSTFLCIVKVLTNDVPIYIHVRCFLTFKASFKEKDHRCMLIYCSVWAYDASYVLSVDLILIYLYQLQCKEVLCSGRKYIYQTVYFHFTSNWSRKSICDFVSRKWKSFDDRIQNGYPIHECLKTKCLHVLYF